MSTYETQDQKWSAVVSRDRNAASAFVFSVTTTGIYCRPNCGARQPRKVNVKFFTDSEAAIQAGYRACKRCKPELEYWDPVNDMIAKACGIISSCASRGIEISLAELASQCDVTKFYLHRTFKKVTGQTPKDFARICCRVHPQPSSGEEGLCNSPQSTTLTNRLGLESASLTLDDMGLCNVLSYDFEMLEDPISSPSWCDPDLDEVSSHALAPDDQTYTASLSDDDDSAQNPVGPCEELHITRQQSSMNAPIKYTLRQTQIGTVLIAYQQGNICALKIGTSALELATDLQDHFYPTCAYEIDFTDKKTDASIKSITEEILEALERPSGKTIVLPFGDNILV